LFSSFSKADEAPDERVWVVFRFSAGTNEFYHPKRGNQAKFKGASFSAGRSPATIRIPTAFIDRHAGIEYE
jgi:hypothetical protein